MSDYISQSTTGRVSDYISQITTGRDYYTDWYEDADVFYTEGIGLFGRVLLSQKLKTVMFA